MSPGSRTNSLAPESNAGSFFRRSEVDIVFLYVTTYALSSTVLPVAQRAKVPVVIMNLQLDEAIDYEAFNKPQTS